MIRGWKNDPRWVEYYEKKSLREFNERIRRIQDQIYADQAKINAKTMMARLKGEVN